MIQVYFDQALLDTYPKERVRWEWKYRPAGPPDALRDLLKTMKVHIKVFTTDYSDCETFVLPCHASNESELVGRFVDNLKEKFPGNEFKTIRIAPHRFNVVPQPVANA